MNAPARRILVLANPKAGFRVKRDTGALVARGIAGAGRDVALHRTAGPGDARRAAASAAADGYDLVVAVGGDGTAHEAANGLVGTRTALAVAPAGTMNLLARVLGVPLDPCAAADLAVRAGRRRPVRPGRAGSTLFLLMAGIGLDAWVLRELLRNGAGKPRFRDYAWGALRSLAMYPFPSVRFSCEGRAFDGHSAVVGRSHLYGGFLRPTPRARLDEAALELCVFRSGPADLLRLTPALWSGTHLERPGVDAVMTVRVEAASTEADVPVQLDGEIVGVLPMTFSIARETLILAA